ncbi:MAG: oligosaccharide flippase family protein, partial [Myxococcales bacterium]|nr:oligosaccharide flippase family protein [Myxococcales bacterium]
MTPAARTVSRGIAWTGVASLALGVFDVAATLLLLRCWLSPTEYGVAAVATTLFPMLDLVADAGFAAAVVQRADSTDDTLSSAFWASLAISVAVAIGLLALGPLLGWIQGHAVIGGLLAGYGVKLVLQNAFFIPNALLRRDLRFGAIAGIRTSAGAAELAGKLIAAAAGLGVWCFLVGQLAKTVVQAVATQLCRPFRPRLRFRRAEAAAYFRFGSRTSASQVLFHLYTNADYQIVGYVFGAAATGLYRAAYELVLEPAKLLSYVIVEVAFPVFSRLRDDLGAARDQLLAFTRQNLLVLIPVLSVLAVAPAELLELFFGARWRPAADAVRLLCVVGGLRALSFLLPPLLDGLGRADLTLRYTVAAAIVVPATQVAAALALGDALGWRAVALAWAVAYPVAFAALLVMALAQVRLPIATYVRAAGRLPGCGAIGLAARAIAARALPWQAAAPRLVVL